MKEFNQPEISLLMIDDSQTRLDQLKSFLSQNKIPMKGVLLDDNASFQHHLREDWDVIIYVNAYDLSFEQSLSLLHHLRKVIPIVVLDDVKPYSAEYYHYVRKGIYDVVPLNQVQPLYYVMMRAIGFARMARKQRQLNTELEKANRRLDNLIESTERAVAKIQDGVHIDANEAYAHLFGYLQIQDIVGQPLIDVIQPQDIAQFKRFYKRLAKGNFKDSELTIENTKNNDQASRRLQIQFSPSRHNNEDCIEILIEQATGETDVAVRQPITPVAKPKQTAATPQPVASKSMPTPPQAISVAANPLAINRDIAEHFSDDRYNFTTLVTFSPQYIPTLLCQSHWNDIDIYLLKTQKLLEQKTGQSVHRASTFTYVTCVSAENLEALHHRLTELKPLLRELFIDVDDYAYPLNLNIGFALIKTIPDQEDIAPLLETAFATPLSHSQELLSAPPSAQNDGDKQKQNIDSATSRLNLLEQRLDNNEIKLRFQQIYDTQNGEEFLYEVTAGFEDEFNAWVDLGLINNIDSRPQLSVKVDRWILVEAAKNLHAFLSEQPNTRLLINLNYSILQHPDFITLIERLNKLIKSSIKHPMILQFPYELILGRVDEANAQFDNLRAVGAEVSLSNMAKNDHSLQLISSTKVNYFRLTKEISDKLEISDLLKQLQAEISSYTTKANVEVIIPELNSLTSFTNAWNINVRYLQGSYFQSPQDTFVRSIRN